MFLIGNKREETNRFSFKRSFGQVQKIFLAFILLASLQMTANFSKANAEDTLTTIYHIYSNDEYIGMLSDKEKLDQLKAEKMEEATSKFEDFSLTIGNNLSIIPERVFSTKADDDDVMDALQNHLEIETEAIGIQVDDELVLYVKDETSYDEVIRELKLQSVSEEDLDAYEASKDSKSSLPELKEDETRIIEINLSSELQPQEGNINPDEVLTVDEAVEFLNKGTLEEKKYTVQSGDVLGKIAAAHDMPTKTLLKINEDLKADSVIRVGDELNVTVTKPYVEVEALYEVKKRTEITHKKVKKNDDSLFKGDKKVTQKGVNGEKVVTELIREKNGRVIDKSVKEEKVLTEPVDEVTVVGTKVVPSRGSGSFQWPAVGGYISSPMGMRWGRMHNGIDIARPSNRSILAADNGVVVSTGNVGAFGNRIVIDHKNGYQTLYAHLESIHVKPGQTVTAGSTIGIMGSTGRSTGVHLHFEVTKNGQLLNPVNVLK